MPMSSAEAQSSAATDHELLGREQALRQEADSVVADLQLPARLRELGTAVRVGSSALGLMVGRDIDITVVCDELGDDSQVVALAGRLARQPAVRQVTYRDDTGAWNAEPEQYPDGRYLGVKYRKVIGQEWNLDVWFVDQPDRMPDLAHLKTMPSQLDPERRLAILRIKQEWAGRPEYGSTVRSNDIYTAVLQHGVRTPEEFASRRTAG